MMTTASAQADARRLLPSVLSAHVDGIAPFGRAAVAPRPRFAVLEEALLLLLLAYSVPCAILLLGTPIALFTLLVLRLLGAIGAHV